MKTQMMKAHTRVSNDGILPLEKNVTTAGSRRYNEWQSFMATVAFGMTALFGTMNANAATHYISTHQQLVAFAVAVNNGTHYSGDTVVLQNDITMPAGSFWTPIGNKEKPFKGTFNGNGKKVTGVVMDYEADFQYAGFFGYVKKDNATSGEVRNLKLERTAIIGSSGRSAYAGGIVGYNDGGTIENCEIISGGVKASCITVGSFSPWDLLEIFTLGNYSVTILADLNLAYAGGVVGFNNNGKRLLSR